MNNLATPNRYKNHRFPTGIISHAGWLYFRFCLSSRDVGELLFARGILVTYEAIRQWFSAPAYRHAMRQRFDTGPDITSRSTAA